ncbi:hypothetical protein PDG61_30475 [Mycolicibacterium sp. BiH015]|uniref:hypothetical protein n=1 Tax=Mycolicibacterium sp. BiH015 TaxID=3018808 RepID=UPI0022E55851|nr:hypothetical protein [Mycolicibacterium sp. BiH015]MDA2895270.1 hypothetical protein [Mycolicibacterium sp. BiH015]
MNRLLVLAVLLVPVALVVLADLTSLSFASACGELVGSSMTLIGLLVAFLRASNPNAPVPNQIRTFLRRVAFGIPRPRLHKVSTNLNVNARFEADAYGLSPLPDLAGRTTQAQVDLLADYIRTIITPRAQNTDRKLRAVEKSVDEAREYADEKSEETFRRVLRHLDEEQHKENRVQVLDVRVAMLGLWISLVGMALGYWGLTS